MALVEMGPSPVRGLAGRTKINRGTVYDILKALQKQGLVSFYDTKTHQHFAAEPPEKILTAVEDRMEDMGILKKEIKDSLPELRSLFEKEGGKPVVKLYEGLKGIRYILEDVLECVSQEKKKEYFVYSSSSVRGNVHQAMPDFSQRRIKKNIRVKTIALGEGGTVVGLDERKWMNLPEKNLKATYEIIYGGKVAHISLNDSQNPVGVIIQNQEIFETQKMIFEFNWNKL